MKLWKTIAVAMTLAFIPVLASAQYKDLDAALKSLERGFGSGETQAVVSGMGEGDQVQLQFPGLVSQSGFFGRDQATYLLEGLFAKVKPSGFTQKKTRGGTAQGQYEIIATWDIQGGPRDLYITLQKKGDQWVIASISTVSGQKK